MQPTLVLIAAYLLGSIPFGYLIVRARTGADVRASGSGATGATNVTRRAGKSAGILTLVLDAAKGAAAVLAARWLLTPDFGINWWVACSALLAVFGHCFPVWLGFKGGKGVATGVGVFLSLYPLALAGSVIVFLLIVLLTRYVSLGSILAAASFPLLVWVSVTYLKPVNDAKPILVAALATSALIVVMHYANIGRLLKGTESKFK